MGSAVPTEEGPGRGVPPGGPWTGKPLTCVTFSRTCARRTLLVSGIMKEGKDQNHAHLKKLLDSEFSLVQVRLLSWQSDEVSFCSRKVI